MLIPKSFSCSDILMDSPFNTILGGLLIILLMFCLEERNIAIVLARFSVISVSTHHFKKLQRSDLIKFKSVVREELEADIVASSA